MPRHLGHRQQIMRLVQDLAEPIAGGFSLELVDVQYVREGDRDVLRLTIDKPGGVGHEDCQRLSEAVSDRLDETDPIPEAYYLEVSSPGVERTLKKDADFDRFAGQEVGLHLFAAQDGHKDWQGILRGFEDGAVLLEIEGNLQRFPRDRISRAHLVFHF